jgi:hypothetical protein
MASIAQQSPETLLSVAAKITEYAQQLTKELEAGNIPPVTLEADSPIKYESLPGNAFLVRQKLEDALKDMYILSQGPSESIFNYCHTVRFLPIYRAIECHIDDDRPSLTSPPSTSSTNSTSGTPYR